MTTNKRFKNVEENLEWGTVQYFTYHDEKITDKELEKLVNHLLNQIESLQSTLAYRSNQLALMEQLIDDLGHEEMKRQMEEILND